MYWCTQFSLTPTTSLLFPPRCTFVYKSYVVPLYTIFSYEGVSCFLGIRAKRSNEESRSSTRCSAHSSRSYVSRTARQRGNQLASTGHWDQELRHVHHVGQLASTGRWERELQHVGQLGQLALTGPWALQLQHVGHVGQLALTGPWALAGGSARVATMSRCWMRRYHSNVPDVP